MLELNNPLLTEDIGVYFLDMDCNIREQVVCNEDGSFSIFINSRLNREQQMKAYQHAVMHIATDDFSNADVNSIEFRAHA